MGRGIAVLEVLILTAITAMVAAYLGSILLKPREVVNTNKPLIIIYSADLAGNISDPSSAPTTVCKNVTLGLYKEGIVDNDKPIVFGNSSNSKYVYLMVIYITSTGVIKGVKISSLENGGIYAVYTKDVPVTVGRFVVCVYSKANYTNVKLSFVGATNNCVACTVK